MEMSIFSKKHAFLLEGKHYVCYGLHLYIMFNRNCTKCAIHLIIIQVILLTEQVNMTKAKSNRITKTKHQILFDLSLKATVQLYITWL